MNENSLVMHHLLHCMHLWGINNSGMHLKPRCTYKADLETFQEKLQCFLDRCNTQHDQETELPERNHFTKEQHNVILRLVELYLEAAQTSVFSYCNNPALLSLASATRTLAAYWLERWTEQKADRLNAWSGGEM